MLDGRERRSGSLWAFNNLEGLGAILKSFFSLVLLLGFSAKANVSAFSMSLVAEDGVHLWDGLKLMPEECTNETVADSGTTRLFSSTDTAFTIQCSQSDSSVQGALCSMSLNPSLLASPMNLISPSLISTMLLKFSDARDTTCIGAMVNSSSRRLMSVEIAPTTSATGQSFYIRFDLRCNSETTKCSIELNP